jgi:S1-C subfamily serine protease
MPFYIAKVPVLHFFTGGHLDYHRTGDDADKINAAGGARTAEVVAGAALALSAREALTYKAAPPPPKGGDARARGASLGTIPAYVEDSQPGMLISDVVPDGPAQKAGLKGGDRILQIGAIEIRTVHDLMYVLVNAKPGEKAKLTYSRQGKKTTVEVTFGPPRSRR